MEAIHFSASFCTTSALVFWPQVSHCGSAKLALKAARSFESSAGSCPRILTATVGAFVETGFFAAVFFFTADFFAAMDDLPGSDAGGRDQRMTPGSTTR